ncbi:MAG: type II toxin-antitoxin system PemK/MazF family toxin [Bifidobacteriaceae bacterium]|jgi:mRNA interferase MazF|nr:type II toxin-antitoxin system PemK/MazF family toxin [Bifidobacteriaceae bacterium]
MRGDIWELRAPRDAQGHEQKGRRYAVEVQSDDLLLSTKLVAPTSSSARPASFRPETAISGIKTSIMVEQTGVVDPETRLGGLVGRLDADELAAVDQALRTVLGLR